MQEDPDFQYMKESGVAGVVEQILVWTLTEPTAHRPTETTDVCVRLETSQFTLFVVSPFVIYLVAFFGTIILALDILLQYGSLVREGVYCFVLDFNCFKNEVDT